MHFLEKVQQWVSKPPINAAQGMIGEVFHAKTLCQHSLGLRVLWLLITLGNCQAKIGEKWGESMKSGQKWLKIALEAGPVCTVLHPRAYFLPWGIILSLCNLF